MKQYYKPRKWTEKERNSRNSFCVYLEDRTKYRDQYHNNVIFCKCLRWIIWGFSVLVGNGWFHLQSGEFGDRRGDWWKLGCIRNEPLHLFFINVLVQNNDSSVGILDKDIYFFLGWKCLRKFNVKKLFGRAPRPCFASVGWHTTWRHCVGS